MWFSNLTLFTLFILPYFVQPEDNFVYDYDVDNFRQNIEERDGNFVMFYAPWCTHCTNFYPMWRELAEFVNSAGPKFAIAQVDCTKQATLCHANDITGYPTLLYFHKGSFQPVEYKGLRDMPSLTLFLSEVFNMKADLVAQGPPEPKDKSAVTVYGGMAYLNDFNIEKHLSKGQHFVMFYAPWCKASQRLAPVWAELAVAYTEHDYVRVGKVNCADSAATCGNFDIRQYPHLLWIANGRIMGVSEEETLEGLKAYVEKMVLTENHDPEKFMKKKKILPVARITEETFETFLGKDLVFINYFAPWCSHCMQLSPLWIRLGEKFQNESRVLIADVDCAREKQICSVEKVKGLPTLVLYKNKKVVIVEHGTKPFESLVSLVEEQLLELSNNASEESPDAKTSDNDKTKDEL